MLSAMSGLGSREGPAIRLPVFSTASRTSAWTLLAVAIVAAIGSVNFGGFISAYDGGIGASSATFLLHGLLPYRDYWLLYGPASGVLIAIPTWVFGPSIELARVIGLAALCAQAAVAFRLARVWAAPGPAVALSIAAVVMLPALLGLDASAWLIAMTFALMAIYLSVGTGRSGVLVGLLVGLAFLSRLDVGVYALVATLLPRDRTKVLIGFAVIAIPFIAYLVVTTPVAALVEQLIWYPIVGPRQFRGVADPGIAMGQPAATILTLPLILIPRLAIALATIRLARQAVQRSWSSGSTGLLGLVVFAAACQLQTLGRGDYGHFAQAATPAILLLSLWFPTALPDASRFAMVAVTFASCVVVGLAGHRFQLDTTAYDPNLRTASAWIKGATRPDERIFVGLTSNRYTIMNPLIVYYLADRAPGVRDTMFNPGVTNTDWGQARMVDDLASSDTPYLVLDRVYADQHEMTADGRTPGSTRLDEYIGAHYRTICDMGTLVILARNDRPEPSACPDASP
jgi:hypothetical protein